MPALRLLEKTPDPGRRAAFVAGAYLLAGALWILLSDMAVASIATSPQQLSALQTAKGWGFVLISGVGLFFLVRHQLQKVERSRNRFQVLAEQSLVGVWLMEDGAVQDVNQRLAEILGLDREAVSGRPLEELVHPEDRARVAEALAEGEKVSLQLRFLRTDGESAHAHLVAERTSIEGRAVTLGLVLDVTDTVRLEERFRRVQRMETLGQLTAAIAHDFNNLLTAIIGPLEMALEDLPPSHAARREVEEARATADRAAALTRQLLTFSKKRVMQARILDLNGSVTQLESLAGRLAPDRVTVEFRVHDGPLPVKTDPTRLEQVLVNLLMNAVEAIAGAGRIQIRTRRDQAAPDEFGLSVNDGHGPWAVLEVADSGKGMPESVRHRIFEPFYSTKKRGTGLGLSTVYGIVEQAGGFISVDSAPGKGTTFHVFWPLVMDPGAERTDGATPSRPVREVGPSAEDPSGLVLVVEDDAAVRTIMERALNQAGYRVTAVADAESALRLLDEERPEVELVVSDMALPGMSGMELVRHLRDERPGLPALLVSGHSGGGAVPGMVQRADLPFLEKPFSPRELRDAVRAVLGPASAST